MDYYLFLYFNVCVAVVLSSPSKDSGCGFLTCKSFILSSEKDGNLTAVK